MQHQGDKNNALLVTHLMIQTATIRRLKECVDERASLVWARSDTQGGDCLQLSDVCLFWWLIQLRDETYVCLFWNVMQLCVETLFYVIYICSMLVCVMIVCHSTCFTSCFYLICITPSVP